jgi:hypothetical protein
MGVYYTAEEVAKGHVAQPGSHYQLANMVLGVARSHPDIVAAALYGSTASVDPSMGPTIRSDVDWVVFYNEKNPLGAARAIREVKKEAIESGCYARLEEHFESDDTYGQPGQIDKQYLQHFARVIRHSPAMVVGDPLAFMDMTPMKRNELAFSVRQYLSAKAAKFALASTSLELDPKAAQRALELPVAITRKVKQVLKHFIAEDFETENKKGMHQTASVILQHPGIARLPGARDALENHFRLQQFDDNYSLLLEQTLRDGDIQRYQHEINRSRDEVFERAFMLSRAWQRVLDVPELVGEPGGVVVE